MGTRPSVPPCLGSSRPITRLVPGSVRFLLRQETDTNSIYYGLVMKKGTTTLVLSSVQRTGSGWLRFLRTGQTSESRRQAPTLLAVSTTSRALPIRVKKQTRIYVDGQLAGTRFWSSGAPPMNLGSNFMDDGDRSAWRIDTRENRCLSDECRPYGTWNSVLNRRGHSKDLMSESNRARPR